MSDFNPPKNKKTVIIVSISVIALLVVVGIIYYTWPKLFIDEKGMPPVLSTGNVQSSNFQGVIFDTGSGDVFGTKTLKYTAADVTAWGTDPDPAGKIHVGYPPGKNYIISYFYADKDLSMMDIVGKSAADPTHDTQVIKPKAGMNIAVAFYSPGEEINGIELQKGYYLFPKGYFVNQKYANGQIQTLVQGIGEPGLVEDDPADEIYVDEENGELEVDMGADGGNSVLYASQFVIPKGRGFTVIASEPFDAWNIKPSNVPATTFKIPAGLKYKEANNGKVWGKGWVLMPVPVNINAALGSKVANHRITDVWYSADQELFTQLSLSSLPTSLPGSYNMAWLYFDKPESESD